MVMITFVQIAIGRCCAGGVRRRTWLGLGGVMLVLGAGLAAYGLNSAFGEIMESTKRVFYADVRRVSCSSGSVSS